MACCTTIPPLNNKRKSGGIFDFPRASKQQRRPFTSSLTTTTSSFNSPQQTSKSSTMFTTTASAQNKHIFVEADSSKYSSVFQMKNAYSPLGDISSNLEIDSNSSTNDESQFKNEFMERIRHEAKRLIKRKQITLSTTLTTITSSSLSNCSDTLVEGTTETEKSGSIAVVSSKSVSNSEITSNSSLKKTSINNNNNVNDLPIFSMNQVNAICQRMIGERETAIREEYDKILTQKMSEQYDAFVKFTHEQIQRRFATSQCSYVS